MSVSLLIVSLLLGSATAVDGPRRERTDLEWTAPEQCPQAEELETRFRELRTIAGLRMPQGTRGHIEKRGDGYRLELTWLSEGWPERRVFHGSDCRWLVRAAAATLASRAALDHAGGVGGRSRTTTPETFPTHALELTRPERKPPQEPPKPPQAMHQEYGVALTALLGAGVLPQLSVGLALKATARWQRFGLRIGLAHWPQRPLRPVPAFIDQGVDPEIRASIWAVPLGLCVVLGREKVTAPLCATLAGGAVVGHAKDTQRAKPGPISSAWWATGLDMGMDIHLSEHWSFILRGRALVNLRRPQFGIVAMPEEPLVSTSLFAFRVGLGVQLRWLRNRKPGAGRRKNQRERAEVAS